MKKFWLLIFIALAGRLLLAFGPYHPDLGNHLDWGIKFWSLKPKFFYENLYWQVSWANQPPGTIYIFAFQRKVFDLFFGFFWWLNLNIKIFPSGIIYFLQDKFYVFLTKLPSILADFGSAYIIYKFLEKLKNKKVAEIAALVFLFNPVIWYNSAVWGQTDSIINFFCLWSVYLFWKQKPSLAYFIYFVSLYFKGSLILFLPVIFILLLKSKIQWWGKLLTVILVLLIFPVISWPFVRWMDPFSWLYHLYRDRVFGHQGNMLTANAFNIWALFYGIDFTRNDQSKFLWLNLKRWGQMLFALSIIPVFYRICKDKKLIIENVFWCLALLSMASFVFLTNMHERYLYPAIPYLTIIIFLNKKYIIPYIILCLVFFLNMYHLWYIPGIDWLKNIYTPFCIKSLSILNLILFALFYYYFISRNRKKLI